MDFANRICVQFFLVSSKILGIMLGVKSGLFFALAIKSLCHFLFVGKLKSDYKE